MLPVATVNASKTLSRLLATLIGVTVHDLPVVNATLNGLSAVLLFSAYLCIKTGRRQLHKWLMLTAVATSAIFLACYIVYHLSVPPKSIGLPHGPLRDGYLAMLLSHVVLAVGMLPLIYMALDRALRGQFTRHVRWSRPAFWIWFYVSVTGVLVYIFLYHIAPALYPSMA